MKTKPRINHGDLTTQITIRLTPSLVAYLDNLATLHGWTRAESVRKVLSHHHRLVKSRTQGDSPVYYLPATSFPSGVTVREALEQCSLEVTK